MGGHVPVGRTAADQRKTQIQEAIDLPVPFDGGKAPPDYSYLQDAPQVSVGAFADEIQPAPGPVVGNLVSLCGILEGMGTSRTT